MGGRRKRRRTGRIIGLGMLVILLLILTGAAGWMLCFGRTGYAEKTVVREAAIVPATTVPATAELILETSAGTDGGSNSGSGTGSSTGENGIGSGTGGSGQNFETEGGQNVTLLFAGDVYLSNHVLNAYDRAGGIQGVLDEKIRSEIEAADLFMVNQEFPFTDRGTPAADKQFTFRLPPDRVHLMNEMGIDLVTLANNHILDYGTDGLLDSVEVLDTAGIKHVGAGKNLDQARKLETVQIKGKTIGFLGTSRVYMDRSWAAGTNHPGVFSTYDSRQAVADIKAAREVCDYLVVYVHWGVERETVPKDYQRTIGREYIDAGADLVIGSHPHVLQEIEYYDGKPIVHSLGNFVFGSSIPETELLKVELTEDGAKLTALFCTSSGGYTRMK